MCVVYTVEMSGYCRHRTRLVNKTMDRPMSCSIQAVELGGGERFSIQLEKARFCK